MQKKIYLNAMALMLILGCDSKDDQAFEKAIAHEKKNNRHHVEESKTGVPYFQMGDLNPTWNVKSNIVTLPDFRLIDQNGHAQTNELIKGKISVLAFFFTSCTGFCPALMKNLKLVAQQFKSDLSVKFVGLSVDPEEDTPDKLKKYQQTLRLGSDKQWSLLTGDRDLIFGIAKQTLSSEVFKKQVTGPKSIIHSEHFYVFDEAGHLRGVLNGNRFDTPSEIKALVAKVQAE